MKFKVTATIPVELEIDCQSKEEALDTATTILQEQRDDGDYASIVADCIESALVSGSITMTAVDDHEALVNELRTKRKISIQDMDAFLGYEIDKNDDMMFDDDYINANLWMHAIALANTCDSRCRDTREEQYNGTSSDAYLQLTFSLKHIEFSGGYNFANLFSAEYRKDTGWFVVSGEGEVLMGTKK